MENNGVTSPESDTDTEQTSTSSNTGEDGVGLLTPKDSTGKSDTPKRRLSLTKTPEKDHSSKRRSSFFYNPPSPSEYRARKTPVPLQKERSNIATNKRRGSLNSVKFPDLIPEHLLLEHFTAIAKYCVENNIVLTLRDINPESHALMQEGCKGKKMETKGKSTADGGPISGLIPINAYLSKETSKEKLKILQEKNDKLITDSQKLKNELLKELKNPKDSPNPEEHKQFVNKFNSQQIIEPITRRVKAYIINEIDNEIDNEIEVDLLYYEVDNQKTPKREEGNNGLTSKPMYFIYDTKNNEYLKYDYTTGDCTHVSITENGQFKPVQVFNTVQIKLNKDGKVEKNIKGDLKLYYFGITSDIDTLSLASGTKFEKEIKNSKDGKFIQFTKTQLADKGLNLSPNNSSRETQIVKDNTTIELKKDIGFVTKNEEKIISRLIEETDEAINHGPETNNLSPEEFKVNEKYITFLPNNPQLIRVLRDIFEITEKGRIKTSKISMINDPRDLLTKTQDVSYITLGGKNKKAEHIEQELCNFINIARACGYPIPINPLWRWTKNFVLKEEFNDEDLIKYIRSNLLIDVTKYLQTDTTIIDHTKTEHARTEQIKDMKLFELELNHALTEVAITSKNSDIPEPNPSSLDLVNSLILYISSIPERKLQNNTQINDKTKENSSQTQFNGDEKFTEDKEFYKEAKEHITNLENQIFTSLEENRQSVNSEEIDIEEIEEIEQLLQQEKHLLDLRLQITRLLNEPEVHYQDVPDDEKQLTEEKVQGELKHRVSLIKGFCKEFDDSQKSGGIIYNYTKNGIDIVSKIMQQYLGILKKPAPNYYNKDKELDIF
jgi:hypothetical protein